MLLKYTLHTQRNSRNGRQRKITFFHTENICATTNPVRERFPHWPQALTPANPREISSLFQILMQKIHGVGSFAAVVFTPRFLTHFSVRSALFPLPNCTLSTFHCFSQRNSDICHTNSLGTHQFFHNYDVFRTPEKLAFATRRKNFPVLASFDNDDGDDGKIATANFHIKITYAPRSQCPVQSMTRNRCFTHDRNQHFLLENDLKKVQFSPNSRSDLDT